MTAWDEFLKFRKAVRDYENGSNSGTGPNETLLVIALSLLIPGLIAAAVLWSKRLRGFLAGPPADLIPDPLLTGIHGWLALFIIRLWLGVVINVRSAMELTSKPRILLCLGFAALAAITAVLLMIKNKLGVKAAKLLLVSEAAVYLFTLVNSVLGNNLYFAAKMSGFLFGAALWWIYLVRSKRVWNTYFVPEWEEPSYLVGDRPTFSDSSMPASKG